jgi:hypothetical protein
VFHLKDDFKNNKSIIHRLYQALENSPTYIWSQQFSLTLCEINDISIAEGLPNPIGLSLAQDTQNLSIPFSATTDCPTANMKLRWTLNGTTSLITLSDQNKFVITLAKPSVEST